MPSTPFHHIALKCDAETQNQVKERLAAASYREPDSFVLEHGYCTSLYVTDPNGMIVALTSMRRTPTRSLQIGEMTRIPS